MANSAKVGVSGKGWIWKRFFALGNLTHCHAKGLPLGLILKVGWSSGTQKWRTNTPQVMTTGDKQLVPVTKVNPSSGEDSGTTFGRSLKIVETFVYENNHVCCLQPRDPIKKVTRDLTCLEVRLLLSSTSEAYKPCSKVGV